MSSGDLPNETGTQRGEGKPETFDFLGFTHISGKDRNGSLRREAQNDQQADAGQVAGNQAATPQRMHEPVAQTGKWLRSVVQGYFNYHAVPGNIDSLSRISLSGDSALAEHVDPSGPEAPPDLGADAKAG